mmetsp:Transcript_128577/g.240504  ORF Transcript_128577/g.240504 Transcript_128577/m.240504 type:complete len:121 (-) Transcript_128577:114-476(-)
MGFACYARFARCRNANVSLFARRVNLGLSGCSRTLAGAPLLQVCAERLPSTSFPEQQLATAGSSSAPQALGEVVEEGDSLVALIDSVVAMSASERSLCDFSRVYPRWLTVPSSKQDLAHH